MKKVVCFVLALAMVACVFTGCGKSDAYDGSTLKIGLIGPLTGGAAMYGAAVKQGAELAISEINATSSSVKLELNAQDDENDAEKSVNAYHNLLDWGMQVLVGTVTTTPCIAVSAEAYQDRVFTLTPSASSTQVTDGKDNVYQLCFNDPSQGTASARYMSTHFPNAKIAVIYDNGSAYSSGIYQTFVTEAENLDLNIVSVGTCTEETTDFSVQLAEANTAGADMVFVPLYYTPASLILNQAKAVGYAPTFFGVDGMDGILTLEGFDTSLAEGVMLLTPFAADSDDPDTQAFVKSYEAAYGETPTQFAADAYDCVYAVYHAFVNADVQKGATTSEICDAMIAAFNELTFSGLTGADMQWENGQVSKEPQAAVIKDGAYSDAG